MDDKYLGYISVNENNLECPNEYTWHNLDTSPVFYFGYAKSQAWVHFIISSMIECCCVD